MSAMQPQQSDEDEAPEREGIDWVVVLYILGGIPAIAGFIILLFTLVNLFPRIPA
jgi:hypothetical protein